MAFGTYIVLVVTVVIFQDQLASGRIGWDKLGTCPPPSGLPGICVFDPNKNCLADIDCKGIDKCCSEGCGKVCKTPKLRCPLVKCSRICAKYAKDKNGCQTCTCVRKPKPGTCPSPPKLFCKRLTDHCKSDFECKGSFKCCYIFCGRRCVPPGKNGPSKPCPPGVPELRCFVPPCQLETCAQYPQAKCVNNYCGGCNAEFYVGLKRVCVRKG